MWYRRNRRAVWRKSREFRDLHTAGNLTSKAPTLNYLSARGEDNMVVKRSVRGRGGVFFIISQIDARVRNDDALRSERLIHSSLEFRDERGLISQFLATPNCNSSVSLPSVSVQ